MWKLTTAPTTHLITRELAQKFVEMEPAPRDRPLSERRLRVYQRVITSGGFRPISWATAYCVETGGTYRVNGKHTSLVLSTADPLPELYVTIEQFSCQTLEDVAKLYNTYDSTLQSRTIGDINASFAGTVPELRHLSTRMLNVLAAGINYCDFGDEYQKLQATDRAERLLDEVPFCVFFCEVAAGKEGERKFRRLAVVAAALLTYRKTPVQAKEFWNSVREETGPNPRDADRMLGKYLGGTMNSRTYKGRPNREIMVKCLHAWNAWRRGETTNLNYREDKPVPAAI